MMTRDADKKREQMMLFSMDDMVPKDHMLRKIDRAIDWNFIYDLVEDKYCADNGRPSMDMLDPVPHFSTFGKNYTRRFKDTELFEQIFSHILEQCMKFHLVDTSTVFVDSTHVKACANSKKMRKRIASQEALWYEEELKKEINEDRKNHGKKPLKEKKDDSTTPPAAGGGTSGESGSSDEIPEGAKTQKCSTSDPESGWFRKGEHKHVFAYSIETACDKHGWILGYTVHPGNEHDSRTWKLLYDKLKDLDMEMMVLDAGYKTPAIARELLKDGIQPLFPYKRPMTKDGFFKKYEYVYDEYYDCYICPADQILTYRTTNREGYKEYKSDKSICKNCPYLSKCTESKEHEKTISRHIWEAYLETSEDIRYTLGNKEIYMLRKETIERLFGSAKEQHGFRYTQYIGNARMRMKAGLTFACMNLKKLAKILDVRERQGKKSGFFFILYKKIWELAFWQKEWCWS